MRELSKKHLDMLVRESGIPEPLVRERGYWTATDPAELRELGFSDSQCRVPALVIPICDVGSGEVVGYQCRPDSPRLNDKKKPVKYETPARWQMRLDAHPNADHRKKIADPSVPLWITEGIKKDDAAWARGLACIGLIGVWNWRGTNEAGGSTALADWESVALKGRVIYIAFDNDIMHKPAVVKAMRRLAGFLKKRGAERVIPVVPAIKGYEGKLGLDDFFVNKGTVFGLQQCADYSLLSTTVPRIATNGRSGSEIHEEALGALVAANDPPTVFVRGGELVRMVDGERIVELGYQGVRNRLTTVANWVRLEPKKDGVDEKILPHCPRDVADHFCAEMEWPGVPELLAVAHCPMLARTGQIASGFGYCKHSKYFVSATEEWPEWDGDPASAAAWLQNDVLVDFPFKDQSSRAHALALMMLPMVRPAIDGPTPLHVIDAPAQSSGKSLLAKTLLRVTQGPNIHAAPAPDSEEEWRKTIMSKLRDGRPYVFFDDLSGLIKSSALNGVLTSIDWSDRSLGAMQEIYCPNRAAWLITCNNANLSTDLTERSVWIRIDSGQSDPAARADFVHPDIETWVIANRPKIISALLCMVRHWSRTKPAYTGAIHGRYPAWSRVVGGILQCCGVEGFMENFKAMRASTDTELVALTEFVARWWEHYRDMPTKASDLLEEWDDDDYLAGRLKGQSSQQRRQSLGYKLQGLRDRTFRYSGRGELPAVELTIVKCEHYQGSTPYKLAEKAPNSAQVPPTPQPISQSPTGSLVGLRGTLGGFGGSTHVGAHAHAREADPGKSPTKSHEVPRDSEEEVID